MRLDKKRVFVAVILTIIIIALFLITLPKNCKSNEECFNNAAAKCSKAKVSTYKNDNLYKYEVLGKKENNCLVNINLEKVSESKTVELRQALEGKRMVCVIPKETLQSKSLKEIESLTEFCTGPLKETLLQISLDKMYEIIVKNIGPIALEIEKGVT